MGRYLEQQLAASAEEKFVRTGGHCAPHRGSIADFGGLLRIANAQRPAGVCVTTGVKLQR